MDDKERNKCHYVNSYGLGLHIRQFSYIVVAIVPKQIIV